MSITHTILRSYKDQGPSAIQKSDSISGNSENNIDDSVAIAANHLIAWTATRANLLSVCLSSDVAVTVYTNAASGGSPTDTIPLTAGQVLTWVLATDGLSKCPFSANVTAIYVTNASASVAAFKIRALQNQ